MLSLFEGVSSSSGCLGKVVLCECDTLCAFHISNFDDAYLVGQPKVWFLTNEAQMRPNIIEHLF